MIGLFGLTVFLAVTEKYRAEEYEFGVSIYSFMLGILLEGLVALVLLEDKPSPAGFEVSEYSIVTSRLTTIPNSSLVSHSSSEENSDSSKEDLSSSECLLCDERTQEPGNSRVFSTKRSVKRCVARMMLL